MQELLGDQLAAAAPHEGDCVWQLPDRSRAPPARAGAGLIVNDWQLSGVWTGATGTPYSATFSYQNGGSNVNLTGSPDFGARIRIVGDPGGGCSRQPVRAVQRRGRSRDRWSAAWGWSRPNNYLTGCFPSVLDLSLQRNIRLGGGRRLQLRVDMFNAPNQALDRPAASQRR